MVDQLTPSATGSTTYGRRYDVDWLRTIAMGLLILYHIVISFQPWARMIYFIQNETYIQWMWVPMSMLNIWRIPLLFMVSGMGVRFAMERRDWKQLLTDRTIRILIPFLFGVFGVCPILAVIVMAHYNLGMGYVPVLGHVWFLGNIFGYVVVLLPLLVVLRNRPDNPVMRLLSRILRVKWLIFLVAMPLVVEAWLVDPRYYSQFAETWHGVWIGLICFFTGFVLVSLRDAFWSAVKGVRWIATAAGLVLYAMRLGVYELDGMPNAVIALESMCWMLAAVGHASVYLNQSSPRLASLSRAVYPVYIVHLPVQYAISYYLLPQTLPALVEFGILLVGTLAVSWVLYEIIGRLKWVRPLFGMKLNG